MGLFARLTNQEDEKIAINDFSALVAEYQRGEVTREEIAQILDLSSVDILELDDVLDISDKLTTGGQFEYTQLLRDVLELAENGKRFIDRDDFLQRLEEFATSS